jgi:hypothetical protein
MKEFEIDVRLHSRTHLELKTSLPVSRSGKERYHLKLYIFSPAQLNIRGSANYQPLKILNDISARTRFSSPNLSLEKLLDPACELSPLFRIQRILEKTIIDPREERRTIYEMQTLVNNYRREMKDTVQIILQESVKPSARSVCTAKLKRTLRAAEKTADTFRDLYPQFLEPRIPESLRTAFRWADENITLLNLDTLAEIFMISRQIPLSDELLEQIEVYFKAEEEHRREFQYISFEVKGQNHIDEAVSYRTSMLKKWSQSSLYIHTDNSSLPKQVRHIFAGLAAASAMTFAVLASFYAQKNYSQNTLPWAIIIILAYVFKDRIKEIMRDVLGKGVPRLIADNISLYRDPANEAKVGSAKERIDFIRLRDVSGRVKALRYEKPNPFRKIMPDEDIVYYSRHIKLNSKKLQKNHMRLEGINEIIRIRIDNWLREMDDPDDRFYAIDNQQIKEHKGKKVYHLHIVLVLKELGGDGGEQLFHYKVVLSKKGLLRVLPG